MTVVFKVVKSKWMHIMKLVQRQKEHIFEVITFHMLL